MQARPSLHVVPLPRAPEPAGFPTTSLRALELLSDVSLRVARSVDLRETLEAIADAVVETLGFEAAVVNLVRNDGVVVAVVRGPQEVHDALAGTVQPHRVWEALLARSRRVGELHWIDGRSGDDLAELHTWVPDLEVQDDPRRWHPMDALFAPLRAPDGALLGVISVDLPRDGMRPQVEQLALLERFALQASLAVERAHLHEALTASAELFRATFDNAPIGMVLIADDGTVQQANRTARRFVGSSRLVGRPCWELVHPEDRETVLASVRAVRRRRVRMEGQVRSPDGRSTAKVVVTPLVDRAEPCSLVQLDDITEALASQAALRRQATTDALTGLVNRATVHEHLAAVAARCSERPAAVLYCDLDDFKLVNDSFGHAAGDEVLVAVSRSLSSLVRDGDLAGRLGGDEFLVVLDGLDGPADAIALAERIGRGVRERVATSGASVTPSLSIGIAYADRTTTAEELMAQADAALYDAKAGGRGRWELYTPALRTRARELLELREELLHAVEHDEFTLVYQPIVDLRTGIVHGFEALLRWQHPARGQLGPDEFLAQLQGGELATPVTDWVFDRALADAATWPAQYGLQPYVAVNLSPAQLHRQDLVERLQTLLEQHGLSPDRVCVEVTEDAVVDGARELGTLTALRELGVHLAVDDFGNGYAGLLSLRDVPADVVKLDRAFTAALLEDEVSRHVVETVVDLCARLGRTVVAEGIESAEQAEALRALGVHYGQGWQLGRPQELTVPDRRRPRRRTAHLTPELDAELRRLQAGLAVATTLEQVGSLAVQAAVRVVGCQGGSLVVPHPDGLATAYSHGYPAEVVNRFLTFPLDAPLPLADAFTTGRAVWMEALEMVHRMHDVVPAEERRHVALAALPLVHDGRSVGAFGVSWTSPIGLVGLLQHYLVELASEVAGRVAALTAP